MNPNPFCCIYRGLVHLQGTLWWGASGSYHKEGLDTGMGDVHLMGSLAALSCKGDHFFPLKQDREPRNTPLATHCPLLRAASDTRGQSLMSWQEEHFSRHKGWAFTILVSGLNYFLANGEAAVASILSLLIIVSSFFCLLGHCYQLSPRFPLRLRHKAFLAQPGLCQSLLFSFRSSAHL